MNTGFKVKRCYFFKVAATTILIAVNCLFCSLFAVSRAVADVHDSALNGVSADLPEEDLVQLERLYRTRNAIKGIEFLRVGPGQGIESRWGHAAIRFVLDSQNPKTDIVVGFAADTGFFVDYISGITGKYKFTLQAYRLEKFVYQYAAVEKRDIYSLIVPTTPADRLHLVQKIVSFAKNETERGKYYFFDNNCISMAMRVFRDSGIMPEINLKYKSTAVPENGASILQKNLATPFYEKVLVDTQRRMNAVNGLLLNVNDEGSMTESDLKQIGELTDVQLNLIWWFSNVTNPYFKVALLSEMSKRGVRPSLSSFIPPQSQPEFYDLDWLASVVNSKEEDDYFYSLRRVDTQASCNRFFNYLNQIDSSYRMKVLKDNRTQTNIKVVQKICRNLKF